MNLQVNRGTPEDGSSGFGGVAVRGCVGMFSGQGSGYPWLLGGSRVFITPNTLSTLQADLYLGHVPMNLQGTCTLWLEGGRLLARDQAAGEQHMLGVQGQLPRAHCAQHPEKKTPKQNKQPDSNLPQEPLSQKPKTLRSPAFATHKRPTHTNADPGATTPRLQGQGFRS